MQCIVQSCENIGLDLLSFGRSSGEKGVVFGRVPDYNNTIRITRFPSEEGLRGAWLEALGRQDALLPDSAVVCSRHFLNEDFYITGSGVREIRPGAIPSSVRVCMGCLDTDSELLLLSKHKLQEAYEQLIGHPCDLGNLQQTLCVQCAQTVRDFSRFREQSLRARSLMMHLLQTHGLVTMRHLELIKREGALKSESVTSPIDTDDSDSHMEHDADNEPDSPLVEEEIEVFVAEDPVMDPLKCEDDKDCLVGLPSRRAYNEIKTRATAEADTIQRRQRARAIESSALHNRLSDSDDGTKANIRNCVVVLYDIFKHPTFVSKQNESLMQTQADSSCDSLNTDTACNDAQYRAASESEVDWKTHTGEKPFSCKLCKYKCKQNSLLVAHLRTHTGEKPYACKYCEFKCANNKTLVRHIRTHTGEKPYACKYCEFKCADRSSLIEHTRTHTGEKPFSCNLCEYKCAHGSNLACHMRIHTGEKPYACKYCEFKCADRSSLIRHKRIHTGEEPYACKYCEFKCAVKNSLVRHTRTHTGEKPYACKYCEFRCADNSSLVRHIRRTHTGEKPYACKYCEFKCTDRSSLIRHKRIHTGEEPYACKYCEFKCADNRSLVRHIRTHTGEKPYACKYCEFRCADNRSLVRHIRRTHTGEKPYACKYCEIRCADNSSLVRHIRRTHTGEKPFSCKLCKYNGAESNALITHMKSHVGGN